MEGSTRVRGVIRGVQVLPLSIPTPDNRMGTGWMILPPAAPSRPLPSTIGPSAAASSAESVDGHELATTTGAQAVCRVEAGSRVPGLTARDRLRAWPRRVRPVLRKAPLKVFNAKASPDGERMPSLV